MSKPTAIVTGGAAGLGLATAEALAKRDYNTVIFDIDRTRLTALAHTLFTCFEVDVTDEAEVIAAVNKVVAGFGTIDVLVNNAGTIMSEPLVNIMNREQPRHSFTLFTQNITINLNAVFLVGSVVAEQMILKRTKGVVVNISSICAGGNAGQSAYSAAKAGVEALTRVWSKELGVFGIRVAAIAPGFMDTESTNLALNEKKLKELTAKTPLRRLGTAQNVAQAVLSVLDNDFINGAVIAVDGGITL